MNPVAKVLIISGVGLVILGLLWQLGARFGLGRLPGDIAIERENFRFYFPLMTSIIISLLFSLALFLFRFFNR